VLPSNLLLGHEPQGRTLHEPIHRLVHECCFEHRPGCHHHPASLASDPESADPRKPEEGSGDHACTWRKVSFLCTICANPPANRDTSVTAVSIIRLYTLDDIAQSKDIAFDNSDQATISAVEANVGIVCACIPAMRPLFALMMPKYFSPAALGNKEPAKDVERPEHIEQKRPQSLHKPAHAPRKSSVAPSSKHASNRGSLVSKVSLQSRPSTVIGPNSSKVSLLSPTPPAAIQKSRDLHSSRLPSSIPEARRSRSESRSVTHSRSVSTSQSRRGSHIAMASITYPARSISHSRSGSNLTVKTSRTHMSSHGSRLPPMAPSEPSLAHGLSRPSESDTISLLAPSAYSRRPSDSSLYMTRTPSWQPQTSIKPLPVTPFPVGLDKYTPLENEEESER
jgi:hypothetical protein